MRGSCWIDQCTWTGHKDVSMHHVRYAHPEYCISGARVTCPKADCKLNRKHPARTILGQSFPKHFRGEFGGKYSCPWGCNFRLSRHTKADLARHWCDEKVAVCGPKPPRAQRKRKSRDENDEDAGDAENNEDAGDAEDVEDAQGDSDSKAEGSSRQKKSRK